MNPKNDGPLTSLFGNPSAVILDQISTVGNSPQTIRMLAESTHLDYKTVQNVVNKFVRQGVMAKLGKFGNAETYKFNVDNSLRDFIALASKVSRRS